MGSLKNELEKVLSLEKAVFVFASNKIGVDFQSIKSFLLNVCKG